MFKEIKYFKNCLNISYDETLTIFD